MNKPIIEINHLSKKYKKGEYLRYYSFRETLTRVISCPFVKNRNKHNGSFWALKDVNFSVKEGEVLGVIGPNGAGKSTLLKILSRITYPTEGNVIMRGRVGSLLEVGTGFHQELTGRENIFLNGSILGMRQSEIKKKFDEIVDFSGVSKFINMPIKHYSSGMYMRLAFAVAAHLDPEILLIDEVLAVGDASFQKKCISKMEEISKSEGRTILFVSHNMSAISILCKRSILLNKGCVEYDGLTAKAIDRYLINTKSYYRNLNKRIDRSGNGALRLKNINLRDLRGKSITHVKINEPFSVMIQIFIKNRAGLKNINIVLQIIDESGNIICSLSNENTGTSLTVQKNNEIYCFVSEGLNIFPGRYYINFFASVSGIKADKLDRVCEFEIAPSDFYGTGILPESKSGILLVKNNWCIY